MQRFHALAMIVLAAVLLASCTINDVKPDYRLKPEGPKGLVVASFTYQGGPTGALMWRVRPAPKPGMPVAPLPVTRGGQHPGIVVFGSDVTAEVDWPPPIGMNVPASRLAGRVAVVELDPGTYDFHWWGASAIGGYLSSGAKPLVIRFKVEAGKATYIGNVHLLLEYPAYRVGVFDKRDRDLPLMKKKIPLLAEEQLVIALAEMPEKSSQPPAIK